MQRCLSLHLYHGFLPKRKGLFSFHKPSMIYPRVFRIYERVGFFHSTGRCPVRRYCNQSSVTSSSVRRLPAFPLVWPFVRACERFLAHLPFLALSPLLELTPSFPSIDLVTHQPSSLPR